ncbi:hypothetical protein [Marinitenerispora sediminis]|uniref:Uncharacterized protein n=1 Tax=Marinitenerispora sediminis TaxID=1931232 RepID=A0A368T0S5_9ACTN|nr:hypothetical protein [Marinitenerispora sediminis]RCV49682.1 hypothetical protein DEF23_23295 [Marinitenerispora sediminis]RCV52154.1 hypothetical protein DEF28_13650 [Marinitenerispora sediminis]RCV53151.1 hypothetical protein DEF24_21000 [Marinitenerispora sediminis]
MDFIAAYLAEHLSPSQLRELADDLDNVERRAWLTRCLPNAADDAARHADTRRSIRAARDGLTAAEISERRRAARRHARPGGILGAVIAAEESRISRLAEYDGRPYRATAGPPHARGGDPVRQQKEIAAVLPAPRTRG